MKNNHKIKLIAASVAFSTSLSAMGGLGGLSVQSNLGEPFSGSVTVTGEEAQILLNGGSASLSNNNLRTSVRKSGDNAVISIRSNAPVNDPVLVFQVGVGAQSRQYTAIIDPPDYSAGKGSSSNNTNTEKAVVADKTGERPQEQRSSSAQANLRDKKAQEQAKTTRQKSAVVIQADKKRNARNTQAVSDNNQKVLSGDYTVRHGETLTSIAEKVRPSGLSTHDTINALVAANPKLFPNQNPNLINAGKVLSIPSAQELKRLAQQPVATGEVKESLPSKPEQVEKTVSASAEATDQSVETPSVTVENKTPNETQDTTVIASAPVNTASEVSEMASEAVAEVSTEETASQSQQIVPTDTVQEEQPASSDEDSGWWRWLLFAGIAAIALWLLLKAVGKKKQTPDVVFADDVEVEDDIVLDNDISQDSNIFTDTAKSHEKEVSSVGSEVAKDNTGSATKAALVTTATATAADATSKSDDTLNVEDDFDDDIFFTETEVVPVEKSGQDFNLDLGAIDKEQGAIVSSSLTQDEETRKRQNADWDKIESTESVYEPDPESEYQHIAVEFDANANKADKPESGAEEQTDINLDTETVEADSVEAPKDGLQPLVESAQKPVELEYEQPATEISGTTDTLSEDNTSDITTDRADTTSFAESSTPITADQDDNALEFEIVGDQTSENVSVQTAQQAEEDVETPLEFDIAETSAASDSAQIDNTFEKADIHNESIEDANLAASTQDTVQVAKDDLGWTPDQQEEGISFQDSEDLSKPIELATAEDTETIEWESISVDEEDSQSDDGFISESVGMTAPLEAKYELAQMYMEIGDPDAARETLQELLEESSGDILEKTKEMLAELNK
ncbi:FimV/HubP family polar landmark protein [Neisseria zalophi]|uniref:LysM peptidoglycan-binding domain-containing protein n=1 Tax=Neisseria zalophi TaxID=640030 RepID=A0A5J6PSY0_9NEIS|nr:FimV/HubP family polar landmark protein [Neisseria zalophi]QEY25739.1 LysM peptidoglycan-binding domain-containing protein [Neisseria zalophi]